MDKRSPQPLRIFERDRAQSTRVTLENYRDKKLKAAPAAVVQTPLEGLL